MCLLLFVNVPLVQRRWKASSGFPRTFPKHVSLFVWYLYFSPSGVEREEISLSQPLCAIFFFYYFQRMTCRWWRRKQRGDCLLLVQWRIFKVFFPVSVNRAPWHWQINSLVTKENQLDATYHFIVLLIGWTCFGHYYAHHQELTTVMFITTFGRFVLGLL